MYAKTCTASCNPNRGNGGQQSMDYNQRAGAPQAIPGNRGVCCTCKKTESAVCPPRRICKDFAKQKMTCVRKYVQPERPDSYAPRRRYNKPITTVEDNTIYKLSYPPIDPETAAECRGAEIRAEDNLASLGKFSSDTTQRHDFRGWPGANKADPIFPEKRSFLGDGPMQEMTTQKHDYTPKPIYRADGIFPSNNLRLSDAHMEDTSTMTASYQPVPEYEQMENFKPLTTYRKPGMPMEDTTVNKLSYVPWPAPEKEDYPWVPHGQFQKPHVPMEGNTIYRNSYLTPGEFECDPEQLSVGGGDSGGDCCVCCPKDKQR